jgi:hypothetical protein
MTELATSLTPSQVTMPVPATPLWDVEDIYRHLVGLVADVLSGNLAGRGTPAWTAAQVEAYSEVGIAELCAEWSMTGPRMEEALEASGMSLVRAVFDLWAHEQDVLGALGRRGDRHDPTLAGIVPVMLDLLEEVPAANPAMPTVELRVDGVVRRLGMGDPELTLRADSYEFVRLVGSRRSHRQMLAADWTGPNPERVFDAITRFDLPTADLLD